MDKLDLKCPFPGHKSSEILTICSSDDCKLNTLNCVYCLM